MDELKALASQTMAGLERIDEELSPAQGFDKMVEMGLIDREGRLTRLIGGNARPEPVAERRRAAPARKARTGA